MKFEIKKARYIHPEQTVICRTDEEDMHGKNYMVVNADKPYAMEVYLILRKHGHIIPFMEERISEIGHHWEEPEYIVSGIVDCTGVKGYIYNLDGHFGVEINNALRFSTKGEAEEMIDFLKEYMGITFTIEPVNE